MPLIDPSAFIAPDTQIIGNVRIGRESSVWFQTVIRGDFEKIRIGNETNIQDLCMCHADEDIPLQIGDRVTIGHRCVIHGCTISDNVLIGMGSVIMNNVVIGEGSIIAAGSVVLEGTKVPPGSLVTGSPGKIKKTYSDMKAVLKRIGTASEEYVKMARRYKNAGVFFKTTVSPNR